MVNNEHKLAQCVKSHNFIFFSNFLNCLKMPYYLNVRLEALKVYF